jgi:hypothetical protein
MAGIERSKHGCICLCQAAGFGHIDSADLGQTGYAGTHGENAERLAGGNEFMLVGQTRSRSHQAHIALEDIPQLGQLVELGSA